MLSSALQTWGTFLRITVCTSPTVLEAEVLVWDGSCQDDHTQLKIVQGTMDAVKYRDDSLDPIVLYFLQQPNVDHVFQNDNTRCHVARHCQDFLNRNHIRVLPLYIYVMNSVDVFATVQIHRKHYRSCVTRLCTRGTTSHKPVSND